MEDPLLPPPNPAPQQPFRFPWWKRWVRWSWRAVQAVGFLLFWIFMALQLPFVQTQLAHWANRKLSDAMGFEVTMKAVSIRWFDKASFFGLRILDLEKEVMVSADVLKADFSLFSMIRDGRDLYLDQAVLAGATVRLASREELNFTQFIDVIDRLTARDPNDTIPHEPTDVHIARIILDNVNFRYDDTNEGEMEEGLFDYRHIHFRNIVAVAENFVVARDTIGLSLKSLKTRTEDGEMQVKSFRTHFLYHSQQMAFRNLYAEVNGSVIRDSLVFKYEQSADFSTDFNRLVRIDAQLDSAVVHTRDLALFAPSLGAYQDVYLVSAQLKGTVENLLVKNLEAAFGDSSVVRGRATFIGLPDLDNALIDLRLKESRIWGMDLAPYASRKVAESLRGFGRFEIDADFFGHLSSFRTDGRFRTPVGYVETDLTLEIPQETYRGWLKTRGLHLGKLSGMPELVQEIDMEGKIKGSGFALERVDLEIDAEIGRFGMLGYDYTGITTDGHIQHNLFEGELSVNDPNLRLKVDGEINFADSAFHFTAQLDTVNLLPTKLADKPGWAKMTLSADFDGLEPSSVSGIINLSNTEVVYGENALVLDFFRIDSKVSPIDSLRRLEIVSSLFDLQANGHFSYQRLLADATLAAQELRLYLLADDSLWQAHDSLLVAKETAWEPYDMDCQIVLRDDINTALRLFDPYIYLSSGSRIGLEAHRDSIARTMRVEARIDTLLYGHYETYGDSLGVMIRRGTAQDAPVALEALALSERQDWDGVPTEALLLDVHTEDSVLRLRQHITHAVTRDEVELYGAVSLFRDSVRLDFGDTHFQFLGNDWESEGACQVVALRDLSALHFNGISFAHESQRVSVNGVLSRDSAERFDVAVSNLDLGIFGPYVGKKIEGRAFAKVSVGQALADMRLDSDLVLHGLTVEDYLLGDVHGSSDWDSEAQQLMVDAYLERDREFRVLQLAGHYRPKEPNDRKKFDMTATLDGASMRLAEPFLKEYVSNLDGTAIGLLRIKGSPTRPILKGNVLIHKGQFKVNYLNTTYFFSDDISIREDFIGMKELKLYDQNGRRAYLNGGVYHDGFSNLLVQLSGRLDRFMALNTTAEHSSLYYGTAIGTGTFSIFGPPDNIDISVNARTEKGTKLYIPLDGYESVEDVDFIRFVQPDTASNAGKEEQEIAVGGIKMDFNVELTPDAYCEIIFDKKAGDIIRGNGQGKIKMQVDLLGEFSMFGDVEILRGGYNFTLLNVVNKEFGLLPKSYIRWSGDPYGAQLDITATYTQKASLAPVLGLQADSTLLNAPEIRKGYPVQVLLHLNGPLLSPAITFDIDVHDYPSMVMAGSTPISLESYVAGFEQRMRNDEQERSKQVFSLIVLKRLSPENAFSGISQSAGSSVSELLTNQLSYWVSQVDENLEVDFDINGLNADALNTLQLRLSYTFMNGRLRVSREGGFTNLQNEADLTSVIGDWTLEYLLTPDGNLRMKMYRKQQLNALSSSVLDNNATNGLSIMRSRSFERWGDLFRKKKMKETPSDAPDAPEEEEDKEEDGAD